MDHGWYSNLPEWLSSCPLYKCTNLQETNLHVIRGTVVIRRTLGQRGPGNSASIHLYSSTSIDPSNGKARLSEKANLRHGRKGKHNGENSIIYRIKFQVDPEFGVPGAFITKNHNNHEFFLISATLELLHHHVAQNRKFHFDCNSWVYPFSKTHCGRIFFSNACYLPNLTPEAIRPLREEELISLRGNGSGERKEWDRVYDYDYYNDLGSPDKGLEHVRPVLGGSEKYPYPRRGRTGRPPTQEDPSTESRPEMIKLDIYVPPDERFSTQKMSEFISNSIEAIIHFLMPEAKALFKNESSSFDSFEEIHDLYDDNNNNNPNKVLEGWVIEKLKKLVPQELLREMNNIGSKHHQVKFPLPQIIAKNEMAWKDDEEFGHEMLAGVNASIIKCLRKFPPQSKDGWKSNINAAHLEGNLDGLYLDEAMRQGRILMLDHHDYLLPFLERINTQEVCVYASRTLLFQRNNATLKPVAIELSLPSFEEGEVISQVFLPATTGTKASLWHLAKAHVVANDFGYHQLISHWLKTHAVVEPFIIGTRRQLSVMHPIHKLLDPHFKDTMHINALARSILINAGGILEKTLFPGEVSMELSSALYKNWNFRDQSLPNDLLKRNLAFEDEESPTGVQLLFDDYPYGADGLEIWNAIKIWVRGYCSIYYITDASVLSDEEIQAWWSEIRNIGHGDKQNQNWWYRMDTISDLVETLTTLIWIASAFHASVNFGQYDYAGYSPNRPMLCRRFIPMEGTFEFAEFLKDPEKYYLKMLPQRFEMTLGLALMEVLSRHTTEEVYLGQRSLEWTDNEEVHKEFKKFAENLKEVEKRINERNRNPNLKNRYGPAKIPYTLLYPDTSNVSSKGGITGKGIPNSVSI
ncbi:linoleate 9S-lipoxygenase A-like [Macadamia integrifolia]|uniref:linoleate 9S-lipoxygenase A-like n=1 Tax=Macadamia integrifolia TaxID=60698 RepID=UPI001C4EA981|nr:linoleate 9S-lipoxygenase A-like [Macadamia integrifolia]